MTTENSGLYTEEELEDLKSKLLATATEKYAHLCYLDIVECIKKNLSYIDYAKREPSDTPIFLKAVYEIACACYQGPIDTIPLYLSIPYPIIRELVKWRLALGR